jgi:two-component system, NarL family, response regulator NreC
VLLVDDHTILRQGIRSLLADETGIVVVGEASDGERALVCVEALAPDVVLMDMVMPGMNGLEATRRITNGFPGTRVLILSMYDDDEYVQQVIQAGASGYLLKGVAAEELVRGIREVHQGSSFLNPTIAAKLIEDYVRRVKGLEEEPETEALTAREREVLKLIAEGNSNRQIADILRLSRKTVNSHRTNIMRKLDVHDVTGLVRYALREGLIELP